MSDADIELSYCGSNVYVVFVTVRVNVINIARQTATIDTSVIAT